MRTNNVIYMIEVYTEAGELMVRRFAANKKTAQMIAKLYEAQEKYDVCVRKLWKDEKIWVRAAEIER